MKNKLLFPIAFFLIGFYSCSYKFIPEYVKKEFSYSPKIKGDSGFVSFNGIYKELHIKNKNSQQLCYKSYYDYTLDTAPGQKVEAADIIFFRNGMCSIGNLDVIRKGPQIVIKRKKFVRMDSYWGFYEVNNMTIKVKLIRRNISIYSDVDAFEQWYKIIDKHTLQPIYFKSITQGACTQAYGREFQIDATQYPETKFYEIDEGVINPNLSWLIKKKWFWSDINEYRDWQKGK